MPLQSASTNRPVVTSWTSRYRSVFEDVIIINFELDPSGGTTVTVVA
jgi:hypothetical protein